MPQLEDVADLAAYALMQLAWYAVNRPRDVADYVRFCGPAPAPVKVLEEDLDALSEPMRRYIWGLERAIIWLTREDDGLRYRVMELSAMLAAAEPQP